MKHNVICKSHQDGSLQDSDNDECHFEIKPNFILNLPTANIIEVWAYNFQTEMKKLMQLSQFYGVIAMDTEFPGICVGVNNHKLISDVQSRVLRSNTTFRTDLQYQKVRANIQATKLIQVGIAISDENGNVPSQNFCWQFNLNFNRDQQPINNQSQALLQKAGIDFQKLKKYGIDYQIFAEFFFASGLILNQKNKWIVFHGSYDLAYLVRLITGQKMPENLEQFLKILEKNFPTVVDLKEIIQELPKLKDIGLGKLAAQTKCKRIGMQHQAGSDSLLTLACYFSMNFNQEMSNAMNKYFGAKKHLRNGVYGLNGTEATKSLQRRNNNQENKIKNNNDWYFGLAQQTVNYSNNYSANGQIYQNYQYQQNQSINEKNNYYHNYLYWQNNYSPNQAYQIGYQAVGQKQHKKFIHQFQGLNSQFNYMRSPSAGYNNQ